MTILDVPLPARDDRIGWRNREWLVTNGLGGYASGTLADICTRRYHGVFVPNLPAPRGRHVLVSRMDEEIVVGSERYRLGGGDLEGQPLDPGSSPWLRSFHLDGNQACWTYVCGALTIEKKLVMPHQHNTACLRYDISRGEALIRVRPFLPFRRQDAPLQHAGYGKFDVLATEGGGCRVELPGTELWLDMHMPNAAAPFIADPVEVPDSWLWREERRGYECREALASPGYFEWIASPGMPAWLVLTADSSQLQADIGHSIENEQHRITTLVERAGASADPFLARLAVAADQFLILPENRLEESVQAKRHGHDLRTVVAGYHWFLDWGRDSMISLEGLMLATGRHAEARATLLTFSQYVRDGLLPNLFPEGAREGSYHTVDATLWYFHAIHRYLVATHDHDLLDELLPSLRDIMKCHIAGTRFNIGVDPDDGLLRAGTTAHALTWMDAHMGDWIVTPRRGKPVEIQALWYNALCLMAKWDPDAPDGAEYGRRAEQVRHAFNQKFWNPARSCLFDVVDGDAGNDSKLRPNQLIAISLDHPVLAAARWPAVVETVRAHLLTPVGLRTLDPDDPEYCRSYHGNLRTRDAAYHQGTVWPWLLGAFIDASMKVDGDIAEARALLVSFPSHLLEGGVGTISEVFDGEWPHTPHGCIAQAWSVAEVLRCWKRTLPDSMG